MFTTYLHINNIDLFGATLFRLLKKCSLLGLSATVETRAVVLTCHLNFGIAGFLQVKHLKGESVDPFLAEGRLMDY